MDDRTLDVATQIAAVLRDGGYPCAIIGAVALAVHGYPRATDDLDLGTLVRTAREWNEVAQRLRARGFEVHVAMPDAEDPLGGVITDNTTNSNPVQVVNYFNPWNGWAPCGKAALDAAVHDVLPGLAVVDVPHLVALDDQYSASSWNTPLASSCYPGCPLNGGKLNSRVARGHDSRAEARPRSARRRRRSLVANGGHVGRRGGPARARARLLLHGPGGRGRQLDAVRQRGPHRDDGTAPR